MKLLSLSRDNLQLSRVETTMLRLMSSVKHTPSLLYKVRTYTHYAFKIWSDIPCCVTLSDHTDCATDREWSKQRGQCVYVRTYLVEQ